MANRSGLLEKESVAFAPIAKPPEMDDLLENTLLNIKIDKSLTKREAEILNLIVAGKTNKEISLKIFRTERTVEYHRHRLMRKLGTKTAADLVKRAIVMGIT
ncbi:MAG: helix-turn-helix transcriptional regulator [Phycisphaerae bacterium]|nr:helix-turn-helix transcriptional regulator [Phycisphaerae bacterium]